jgi:hypothetical protein
MFKEELEYQVSKAIEYIERGGAFEKWLESKDFTQEEINYIKNHSKIIEIQSRKI